MTVSDLLIKLNEWAPFSLQEKYDNSGLLVGSLDQKISGVLVALDCIEKTVEEAIQKGANTILAHHPIIFSGLKSITGKNYVERTVINAIKNDINIIAIHTNLDNVMHGVNGALADLLKLNNQKILQPKGEKILKLTTYVPTQQLKEVMDALFAVCAGKIGNYSECSFTFTGKGTFMPNKYANPFVSSGNMRHYEKEKCLTLVFDPSKKGMVEKALMKAHPYETPAYQIVETKDDFAEIGFGMIGELENPLHFDEILSFVKERLKIPYLKSTASIDRPIKKVAVCGGSGSFLLGAALRQGVDLVNTSDIKYNEFFDAENRMIIMDIGHFESEQHVIGLISNWMKENTDLNIVESEVITNPVRIF